MRRATMRHDLITFEAATHTYRAGNGIRLRSVTGVLRDAGLLPDAFWFGTEAARLRGRAVHAITQALEVTGEAWPGTERGVVRWPSALAPPAGLVLCTAGDELAVRVPEALWGFVDAFEAFRRAYAGQWYWTAIEQIYGREDLGVAGRPDRVGVWRGRLAVVEYKTGSTADWHRLQLAGYAALIPGQARERIAAYFRATGRFRVERHDDALDFPAFARALLSSHKGAA